MENLMFSLLLVLMHISDIGAFHPDISLKGNIFKYNNQSIINLECSTTLPSIGCTIEYLINGISVDDLRSTNNICYHSKNVCDYKICSCSNSCKEFILNITIKESNAVDDTKFTCISRIKIGWQIYMATISILQHGSTFRVFEKILKPITVMTLSPDVSTYQPDQDTALEIKDVVVIVCAVLSAVLVFFIFLKTIKRKCCKQNDGIHVPKSEQSGVFITNSNMDSISSQCNNVIVAEEEKMHSRDSSGDSNQSDELKMITKLLGDRKDSIQSVCNGLICLSWRLQKSTLMFKCITSQVRAQISFFDQYDQEQGFCTIPFPFSQCINFYQNGSFRQNLMSKETAYDVRGKLGIHMNGYWTCHYGKNKEAAVTNVNIFNNTDFRLPAFILLTGPSKVKPNDSFWLSCFSNVLLSIKAVRFYINNRMYAVLTNDINGCNELVNNRLCTPDTCNCSVDGRTHAVIHEGFKSSGLFVVECRVEFEESFVMSDCFILDVLDIEGLRIIQDKEMPFLESDNIKLTCVVYVQQMHTKLEWECFNMEPDEEFQNSTFMKSSISFTVRSIMNDKTCFCRLKNNGYETSTKLKFKITQHSTNREFNLHYTVWIFSGIIVGVIILVLICVYKLIRVGMRGSVNVRAVYQAATPTHAHDNTYDIPEELIQNEEMNAIQNIDLAASSDNEYEEDDKEVSNGTEGGYQIPHDYMEVF